MREGLLDLIGQAREWGVNLFRAAPPAAATPERRFLEKKNVPDRH